MISSSLWYQSSYDSSFIINSSLDKNIQTELQILEELLLKEQEEKKLAFTHYVKMNIEQAKAMFISKQQESQKTSSPALKIILEKIIAVMETNTPDPEAKPKNNILKKEATEFIKNHYQNITKFRRADIIKIVAAQMTSDSLIQEAKEAAKLLNNEDYIAFLIKVEKLILIEIQNKFGISPKLAAEIICKSRENNNTAEDICNHMKNIGDTSFQSDVQLYLNTEQKHEELEQ